MPGMDSWTRDGLQLDVLDRGPAAGEPVVCLHGFPQDATSFDGVAARLAAQGLRVLAPDQRGYSPGARPPDVEAYALGELVADVLALLDAAGLASAHLVGHDWGGAVAWALAGRHGERVRSLTVLSTPHPRALRATARRSSQGVRSLYMAAFQVPVLPELALTWAGGLGLRAWLGATGLPAARADHYVSRMREPGAMTAALAWYRAIPASRGQGGGRVGVPTTYLWGTRDPFFSRAAAERTAGCCTGPLVVQHLDGAGHWLPETHPEEVAGAVLDRVRRSSVR